MERLGDGHMVITRAGFRRLDVCQPCSQGTGASPVVSRAIRRLSTGAQGVAAKGMVAVVGLASN